MASIDRVVISISDKEIELSLDEAKELQEILNKTFPKAEKEYITIPYPYSVPYPVHPYPIYKPYIYWTTYANQNRTLSISQTQG